jgi:inorganic pyrophosphatase
MADEPVRGVPGLSSLPASPAKGLLNFVVESPAGATSKIKYDPDMEQFTLSRPLPLGLVYPHDWGFVPGTRAADGDPVDALVLTAGTTFPGMVLRVRPIGLVLLEQNKKEGRGRERNDRIIAVVDNAPRTPHRRVIDLPIRVRQEVERFFLNVTFFEKKAARVLGWEGPRSAMAMAIRSRVPPEDPGGGKGDRSWRTDSSVTNH